MPFTVNDFIDLVRILETHPEWRSQMRRILLTDELLELPEIVKDLVERTDFLAQQQIKLVERVDFLAQQQTELTEKVNFLAQQQIGFAEKVSCLADSVNMLVNWQRGEAGRREGERYERQVVKDALYLFRGGDGGTPDDPVVRSWLSQWLRPVFEERRELKPEERPTLADLIWRKGEKVVVVEASLKVDGEEVMRAFRRAGTLRLAKLDATGVVVGEDWANLEARELAKEKGVFWFIAGIPSEGLVKLQMEP